MTNKYIKLLSTGVVVLVAVWVVTTKYWYYLTNPWTRDGQVRAQVIQITPRVSGPIVELPIKDNQFVKAGDLLFKIDPRTFQAAVNQAQADLQQAQVEADDAKAEADRARNIRRKDMGAMSTQQLERKENDQRRTEAAVLGAQAALEQAQLNLEFTEVRASVDGYVTNLNLRLGSQAVANQSALALIDSNSFWVHGFFREDRIGDVQPGDRAIVTLMSYPDRPLEGQVDSLGWGIAQDDGSTSYNLLPKISATFDWIRLAQRVPVRVHLVDPPKDIPLRVGTTASVMVMTGNNGSTAEPVPPLPRALQ
jgi:RND family efflux transporter MFP subunit